MRAVSRDYTELCFHFLERIFASTTHGRPPINTSKLSRAVNNGQEFRNGAQSHVVAVLGNDNDFSYIITFLHYIKSVKSNLMRPIAKELPVFYHHVYQLGWKLTQVHYVQNYQNKFLVGMKWGGQPRGSVQHSSVQPKFLPSTSTWPYRVMLKP